MQKEMDALSPLLTTDTATDVRAESLTGFTFLQLHAHMSIAAPTLVQFMDSLPGRRPSPVYPDMESPLYFSTTAMAQAREMHDKIPWKGPLPNTHHRKVWGLIMDHNAQRICGDPSVCKTESEESGSPQGLGGQ
ncbi:hypothetical protein R3P38DRAFT_3193219 [Favolaschia claudopus]|uniref:Uncharacterized protein n=1 Tax=Favolaschia claudopus TaxID=2862362 RepID=A0AAW0BG92_9AGAR